MCVIKRQIQIHSPPARPYRGLLLILVALVPTACLVVPVRSTYYEPNALDGTPEQTVGVSKRKDTAGRALDGFAVHVRAESTPERSVIVGIRISSHQDFIEVTPDLIELRAAEGKAIHAQSVVNRNLHGDQSNRSSYWITLTYPEAAASNEIAIVFTAGSIKKNGLDLSLQPFRFSRVTKWNAHVY